MRKYTRVSYGVRCQIFALLQAKLSIQEIADQVGFHKTTIYREIKRNSVIKGQGVYRPKVYDPIDATYLAKMRFKRCRRKLKVRGQLERKVVSLLQNYWTPEQIAGRLKHEKVAVVSHQSIYTFIHRKKQYAKYLPYQGMRFYRHRRNRKGRFEYCKTHISQRPQSAKDRSRIGHWERDLMYANSKAILVCTDRKSRFTLIKAINAATADIVTKQTHLLLQSSNRKVQSVTNDNGSEFKNTDYPTYWCDPYKPWQRGTVENTIGVMRRFIKKKTEISGLNLEGIQNWLNMRPRKVLDYRTPFEVFYNKKVALVI